LFLKFISLIFQSFFFWLEGRERIVEFRWREIKWLLTMIWAVKMVKIDVNEFHLIRRVSPSCFFLLLTRWGKSNCENVFGFGLIVFSSFFLLRLWIGLSRCLRCFPCVLGEKWFFKLEKLTPCFFNDLWILHKIDNTLTAILFQKTIRAGNHR